MSNSRNPDSVAMSIVRETSRDVKIVALFDLMQDRIAGADGDSVLACQMRDALGFIEFSVNQVFRRLEFHQHRQTSFRLLS